MSGRQRYLIAAVFTSLLQVFNPVVADDSGWYRYENGYFIGYSNASEDRTLKLLVDLETFRAAFSQIANIDIPPDAPKTQVLILRAKSDFKKLTYSKNVAGFASQTDDGMVMVLPASGDLDWGKAVIRHEYGHALLRYKAFDYPQWYDEGFAEMSSTIELTDDRQSFVLGKITDRARYHVRPSYDWNELISDDFDPHRFTNNTKGSSAYVQAWMMAHYMTIGDQGKNAPKLQRYFDALKTGQSSTEAFKETFGVSASELWATELKDYMSRVPYYTIEFKPGAVDAEFRRSAAEQDQYRPKVNFFRRRAIALKDGKSPRKPLSLLPGEWDNVRWGGSCADPGEVTINEGKQTLTYSHFGKNGDGQWEPRTFSYALAKNGTFTLSPVNRPDSEDSDLLWYLQMRSARVLCWRRSDWEGRKCGMIFTKCSPSDSK